MNRLEAGTIFHREIYACLDALQIDQARAYIAIHHLQDPDRYFTPVCETLALLSDNLTTTLVEYEAACQGDFQPIRARLTAGALKVARPQRPESNQWWEVGFSSSVDERAFCISKEQTAFGHCTHITNPVSAW